MTSQDPASERGLFGETTTEENVNGITDMEAEEVKEGATQTTDKSSVMEDARGKAECRNPPSRR